MRSLIILLILSFSGFAQSVSTQLPLSYNNQKFQLLAKSHNESSRLLQQENQHNTTLKAALFSAAVPGAGQVYNKSYWKAAAFIGLEVAFWSANIIYNQKGDREDKNMRSYGDVHWREQRYWSSIYHQAVDKGISVPDAQFDEYDVVLDDYYNQAWIDQMRQVESQVGTHTLPTTKTQQYYEMIYKYLGQFGAGWDDVPALDYYESHSLTDLTPHIAYYRDMRDRSNSYYDTANTMVILVMVNHLASALEAAWSRKHQNNSYHLSFRGHRDLIGWQWINLYGVNLSF